MNQHLPLPIALVLCAGIGSALADNQVRSYNIPAQSLDGALQKLADQSGVAVMFTENLVAGKTSPKLSGEYTAKQALQTLLVKTGLTYTFTSEDAVAINADAGDGATTKLPVVNVVDKPIYSTTDPYNEDYALPNATAGTKTDTPIIETPLNVQVISKQVLKDQQAITLGDALKNVSGVTITSSRDTGFPSDPNGFGATNITLRGFASQTYFRDGFRLQQGAGARQLANVESIEVLKGPAAVLYGLVEPGGLVNVVTKQPQATPYYAVNQQFGSFDNYRTTADATGPLAGRKDLLYRLNISYQTTDGFQDFTGSNDIFVAPVLSWQINPETKVSVELEYNRQRVGLNSPFNPFINGRLLDIPISRSYGEFSPATTEVFLGGLNWSHEFNDDWSLKHRFTVNQQNFVNRNLTAVAFTTSPEFRDALGLTPPFLDGFQVLRQRNFDTVSQNNTYSTNLDVVGYFDTFNVKHTLLLGGDYYRINNNFINNRFELSLIDPFNPVHPGIPLSQDLGETIIGVNEQIDQYGLYLQDQIKLPFDFHFTGGFRYQYLQQNTVTQNFGTVTTNVAQRQDAITPRVGLLWHPQEWISLYANYSESFGANTGLVFIADNQFAPVAPTSAKQIEGGIKTEFFSGRLRATLAYYDLTKTNVAVTDPVEAHNCGLGPFSCFLAIGEVNSQGPELDIQGEILPGWNAIATWANVDVRITKTNAENQSIFDANTQANLEVGDRLFNVPRNTASFWTTYEFQNGETKGLKFGGGVTVQEGQIGSPGLNGPIKVPGFATLSLFTAYSHSIGKTKITAQLNVDNVLDKKYYTNINGGTVDPGNGLFGASAVFGAPRTFLGLISVQY